MAVAFPEPFSEEISIVFLGSLNPAIFHPEWFARQRLVGAEAAAEANISVVSPQVTEIELGPIHLQCETDKLVLKVSRASFSEMLYDLARGILRALPHTPLRAAGINNDVHFRVATEEQWHHIGHSLAPKQVWDQVCEQPGMLRLTIKSPRTNWEHPLEEHFTVEPYPRNHSKHPAIVVRTNTHFPLPDANGDEIIASELAFDFLETQWDAATQRGRIVAETILRTLSV